MKTKKREDRKNRIALRITGRILSVLVILFLFFNVLGQVFFPNILMDVVGVRVFNIGGTGSMMPVLQERDLIVVRRFDFDKLEVGDFVTFESEEHIYGERQEILVTHAIIEVVADPESGVRAYRTSGVHPDISPDRRLMTVDGANDTNRYVGKYAFHISVPSLELRNFLTSTPGIISMAVNLICLIGIGILLMKEKDEEFVPEQQRYEPKSVRVKASQKDFLP